MDPNVSEFHNINGNQFSYNMQSQTPLEHNNLIFRSYNTNPVNNVNSRSIGIVESMSSRNVHESVIKNYKNYENIQRYGSVQSEAPQISHSYSLHGTPNYDHMNTNGPSYSSVIKSTNYVTPTHYQNVEYQETRNIHCISNNMQKWDNSSNYFCKKLPDFSNINMEASNFSKCKIKLSN